MDPMDKDALWPHNIEICLTRIPIRKRDGYNPTSMQSFAEKLKSCMVHNGIVFLICYAPVEAKWRPFEVAKTMADAGFNHLDNIVVEKTWFPGKRSEVNLVNSHEYVMYFCNGEVWKLDRLPIKAYQENTICCDKLLEEKQLTSCPGNTWKVKTGSLDESISFDLAELLLRMTDALPGSIVFDPYMGNQSSLQASIKLGHSFYGFERDTKKLPKYKKAIKKFQDTGDI